MRMHVEGRVYTYAISTINGQRRVFSQGLSLCIERPLLPQQNLTACHRRPPLLNNSILGPGDTYNTLFAVMLSDKTKDNDIPYGVDKKPIQLTKHITISK